MSEKNSIPGAAVESHSNPSPANPRRQYPWSADAIGLIGSESDAAVASTLGVTTEAVFRMRCFLGRGKKSRAPQTIYWPPALLSALGRVPDHKLAMQFGISRRLVGLKRQLLGIKPCPKPRVHVQWTRAMLDDLPVLKSIDMVKKHGLKMRHVVSKRKELGVPSKFSGGTKARKFTDRMIALLGQRPDKVLARNFLMSKSMVRAKRSSLGIPSHKELRSPWTPEALSMLGMVSDMRLAKLLGLSSPTVLMKRRSLGILPAPYRKPVRWTKQMRALIGTMSDEQAAKMLGIGKSSVSRKRAELGIPAFMAKGQGAPQAGTN